MTTTHDRHYKQLFAHAEIMRDLLIEFVPGQWVKQADFSTLERVNSSYVSDGDRQRHGDMVWRLKVGGDWLWVYLLLEFQTRPDTWMALRMMVYLGLLAEDLARQRVQVEPGKLPPILPIVLYRGRDAWTKARDVAECFVSPPAGLECYLPHLSYFLIDENRLRIHPEEAVRNFAAALFRMEQRPDLSSVLAILRELRALCGKSPALQTLLRHIGEWVTNSLLQADAPASTIESVQNVLENDMLVENMRRWFSDARQQGREEGRQEGREEGIQKGQRESQLAIARNLLDRGTLPEDIAEITRLSLAEIRALLH